MDRTTAHDTYLAHRPSGWLAAIGLNRCAAGCGGWPCTTWHQARDARDQADREDAAGAAVARILGWTS